jgi:hypothetical protein
MLNLKRRLPADEGWTFVEAILSVVIMAIMVLGLSIVLMAFREHLDRSWAIRVMDQYGNDVVERVSQDMRNSMDLNLYNGIGNTQRIELSFLDPNTLTKTYNVNWTADPTRVKVFNNGTDIDRVFPPRNLGRGESYSIVEFRVVGYGADTKNNFEIDDASRRNDDFLNATYELVFTLRYQRLAINPGERNWSYQKTYRNRVYMRNKNLVVKQGVTQ